MSIQGWITGWCSGPNHHLCHHVYDVRGKDYTCVCECHQERPVKQVARRVDNGGRPVRYVQRRQARS